MTIIIVGFKGKTIDELENYSTFRSNIILGCSEGLDSVREDNKIYKVGFSSALGIGTDEKTLCETVFTRKGRKEFIKRLRKTNNKNWVNSKQIRAHK